MINITEKQLDFLVAYVPNVKKLATGEEVQYLLDAIDDEIIANILSNEVEIDEPDELGIRLQKVWDEIYNQNV